LVYWYKADFYYFLFISFSFSFLSLCGTLKLAVSINFY